MCSTVASQGRGSGGGHIQTLCGRGPVVKLLAHFPWRAHNQNLSTQTYSITIYHAEMGRVYPKGPIRKQVKEYPERGVVCEGSQESIQLSGTSATRQQAEEEETEEGALGLISGPRRSGWLSWLTRGAEYGSVELSRSTRRDVT